jgi:hypothetical protein
MFTFVVYLFQKKKIDNIVQVLLIEFKLLFCMEYDCEMTSCFEEGYQHCIICTREI